MNTPAPIAAVLLAAGRSSRFGSDKMAADCGGQPVLTRAALALRDAAPGPSPSARSGRSPFCRPC